MIYESSQSSVSFVSFVSSVNWEYFLKNHRTDRTQMDKVSNSLQNHRIHGTPKKYRNCGTLMDKVSNSWNISMTGFDVLSICTRGTNECSKLGTKVSWPKTRMYRWKKKEKTLFIHVLFISYLNVYYY